MIADDCRIGEHGKNPEYVLPGAGRYVANGSEAGMQRQRSSLTTPAVSERLLTFLNDSCGGARQDSFTIEKTVRDPAVLGAPFRLPSFLLSHNKTSIQHCSQQASNTALPLFVFPLSFILPLFVFPTMDKLSRLFAGLQPSADETANSDDDVSLTDADVAHTVWNDVAQGDLKNNTATPGLTDVLAGETHGDTFQDDALAAINRRRTTTTTTTTTDEEHNSNLQNQHNAVPAEVASVLNSRIVTRGEPFVPSRDPPRPLVQNFVRSPGGTWHEVTTIDPASIYLHPDAVHHCALIRYGGDQLQEEQLQDGRDDAEEEQQQEGRDGTEEDDGDGDAMVH